MEPRQNSQRYKEEVKKPMLELERKDSLQRLDLKPNSERKLIRKMVFDKQIIT